MLIQPLWFYDNNWYFYKIRMSNSKFLYYMIFSLGPSLIIFKKITYCEDYKEKYFLTLNCYRQVHWFLLANKHCILFWYSQIIKVSLFEFCFFNFCSTLRYIYQVMKMALGSSYQQIKIVNLKINKYITWKKRLIVLSFN